MPVFIPFRPYNKWMITISTKVVYNIISDTYISFSKQKGTVMSFDINGPSPVNKPMIQESQHTSDGGAGNLGYFQRGKQKKKKEDEFDSFEFSSGEDAFEKELDQIEDEEVDLKSITNKIKGFFKKKSDDNK